MPSDWILSRDAAFQAQAEGLVATIASHAKVWGLSSEELLSLQQSKQDFDQAMADQAEQATLYHQTVAAKQAKREELERALRQMVRRINNHPGMTEALRKQMNLTSPTRARTPREADPQTDRPSEHVCGAPSLTENE